MNIPKDFIGFLLRFVSFKKVLKMVGFRDFGEARRHFFMTS